MPEYRLKLSYAPNHEKVFVAASDGEAVRMLMALIEQEHCVNGTLYDSSGGFVATIEDELDVQCDWEAEQARRYYGMSPDEDSE